MLFGVVLRSMFKGTTAVLLPGRFDPERVLDAIERERVTSWLALGSAAPRVCAHRTRDRHDTSSLRHVGIGGAPVSPSVQQAIRDTFPSAANSLSMGYASSESVAVVANIAGAEFIAHPTSTGRPNMTTAVETRDERGAAVPDGEMGEIHVRSPYVMLGYWRDPAASTAVLKDDGWLAMGDVGRLVDGFLFIDSRARDMILVSAENVSPTEVEHCLEAHPDVLEAAVFAVDDDVTGDAVCAVVVTDPTSDLTQEELAEFCAVTLARYKVPTHWHLVHERLPRTASGKLVKHEIRARVEGSRRVQEERT
jgi:acyl-CoA synthetase (AMP-forming)/AMP-acid ligase II